MWKRRIRGIKAACAAAAFCSAAACAQGIAPQPEQPLVVSGPCVVFFTPKRAERDSIAAAEGLEIDDLLDDFNLSAGKTAVFLSRYGIRTEFTEARTVMFRNAAGPPRVFDRRSVPDPVGLILSDGVSAPRFIPGRGTERDFIIAAADYFHLRERGEE